MQANYFFIDGSALTAQIRRLRKRYPTFVDRYLNTQMLIEYFAMTLRHLGSNEYKRATFYFPVGDESAIKDYVIIPDHGKPGEVSDIHFKYCGQKLKGSAEFDRFVEESVPEKWKHRFSKSEKGIDIEMCCDAFKLASASRVERLFC